MNETLISIGAKSDFEKLLFAQRHIVELQKEIKSLKLEIGVLQSDLAEVKYENKVFSAYTEYKKQNKHLRDKIKHLREVNKDLISKLISVQSGSASESHVRNAAEGNCL